MSLAEKIAEIRPLMTKADIEALIGPVETKRALDQFGDFKRLNGLEIFFSHADGVIDMMHFGHQFSFPPEVAVCGVRIGMTPEAACAALPGLALPEGSTGEPNQYGVVGYSASLDTIKVGVVVKDGKVSGINLTRADLKEAHERRERKEAERRAEMDRARQAAEQWKSIAEPNAMLLSWAEHCSPWTDIGPPRFVAFAQQLIDSNDPDVWHHVATSWNWDYDHAVPLWIIRQKDCDIATALEIFFLAEPSYYYKWVNYRNAVPKNNLEMFDFLTEIRDKIAQGFYQRSEIEYDGPEHMKYEVRSWDTDDKKAMGEKFYPPQAGTKIAGRDLTEYGTAASDFCNEIMEGIC